MPQNLTKEEAIAALWEMGELSWKLNNVQIQLKSIFDNDDTTTSVVVVSRRTGKTYWLIVEALMQCLKYPNSVVKFVFPKAKDAKTNIRPLMRMITEDCPEHLRPEYNTQDKIYYFKHNNSEIQLAGCDNGNVDGIRGGFAHLCIVDEAGYCSDLKYAVRSVLAPTVATTKGRIILASTPSKSPDHEFVKDFMLPYKEAGRLKVFTIHDNPNIDDEGRQKIIKDYPLGEKDPDYRREHLCEVGIDEESAICPEMSENESEIVLKDQNFPKPPPYASFYVGLDPGMSDLTAMLFCYYNFDEACLYVMDECVIDKKQARTDKIATELKLKETTHFTREGDLDSEEPLLRIMDLDLRLQADLMELHDLRFVCTAKDNLQAAVNKMRVWISQSRIKIHERCINLIYHLKYGQWNNTRTKFKHLAGDGSGNIPKSHVDTIPALYYLVRNLYENYNPKPAAYGHVEKDHKRASYLEKTDTWNRIGKALMGKKQRW